ncbi:P-loop containing nucleoside triphosphate hydrolase protein, partial [Mycena maculata]
WENVALCITWAYATLLACFSLGSPPLASSVHLNVILLVSFFTYAYRDLWPFATFTLAPQDLDQGRLLWAKIFALAVAAVVVPLSSPRRYIPADPENPMAEPNAEQTSSLFSSLTYGYLDSLIFLAYKQGGLSFDQFPTLADYDRAEHLIRASFPVLDPHNDGACKHLLYGIFRVFRREYISMFILTLGNVFFGFAGPVAMNRLLAYVPTLTRSGLVVRPWVWVVSLFLVPFFRAVNQQRYTWIACRQKTQAEGILVQLLFAHSLRIRMNTEAKDSNKRNLVGRINNLATSDVANLTDVMEIWINGVFFPLQVILAIWFLYLILGWSSFVGLAVILVTLPLPYYLSKKQRGLQVSSRKKTDARVQQVTETMNVLRMIKWFAWEGTVKNDIAAKRDEELASIARIRLLGLLGNSINAIIPLLTMLFTFSTYTLVMKQELTASIVFTALTVFDGILRLHIQQTMNNIPIVVQGKVSLDRIDDFLRTASGFSLTELLDSYTPDQPIHVPENPSKIGFREAEFSWSSQSNDTSFKLRIESEIVFRPGAVNLIVGPTGVVLRRRWMLMRLQGEMHYTKIGPDSWFNLPPHGGVAYTSQQPWIENATIKGNIVFDRSAPFNETRYKKVLFACALYPDLELLPNGDETEVGERGLTLSGGQKARVSLARAIYSPASTILLDDIFAALDIHTAQWIVRHCFSGDLIEKRTVILVTHNIDLAGPVSQWVVSLSSDGSIMQGSVDVVLKSIVDDVVKEQKALEQNVEADIKRPGSAEKLISSEKFQQGMVKWPTCKFLIFDKLYLANLSSHPILYLCLIVGLFLLTEATASFQYWFLGFWSSQYVDRPPSSVSAPFYLGVYAATSLVSVLFYIAARTTYTFGAMRTTKIIHALFIESVIGTTLRWLDTTPMSRVITRSTQDISKVDNTFAIFATNFMESTIVLLVKFAAVMIISPAFILPGATIALVSLLTGRVYMRAQLPMQRQMSAARSPMLAHFAAAIAGLSSIRAYGAEKAFLEESLARINHFIRPAISFWNLNRQVWITVRSEIFSGVFSASLGWYLVYGGGSHYGAADVGFSISMALSFTARILVWVRVSNGLQLAANNLERVAEYIEVEQEPKPTRTGVPPAYWPASGTLSAVNLSAKYSADGPEILHDLTFDIKSGERIAIVGRTGSGKSSLTLALLRSIPTEGKIYFDGIPTDTINLDALRSNVTIIPQVPELLGGSLRRNLDPFGVHDDSVLNDALRAAGLFSLQVDGDEKSLTLDFVISGEGSNLSVGQRQIVALARAIIRGSRLLILDEATSAIDYQTDAIIQSTLRNELTSVTLITVAHRLRTIMDYDRIMVLNAGRIVEFDTPSNLLKIEAGHLRALVDESNDRNVLLAMAEGSQAQRT